MRRFLIRDLLPLLLCALPVAGAVLVVAAVPTRALDFYLESIRTSYLDWIILTLGGSFFLIQLVLAKRALRWLEQEFDQRPDPWIQRFYQAAEWFPLLGLFGTVAGILQTFGAVGAQGSLQQREIIHLYAPALTTTASGLLMALLNILPLWLVAVGRGLILSLSADPALTREP
jgi:MotA/TolQ/ExbB proton channel family